MLYNFIFLSSQIGFVLYICCCATRFQPENTGFGIFNLKIQVFCDQAVFLFSENSLCVCVVVSFLCFVMNAEDRRVLIEETLEIMNRRLAELGVFNQERVDQNGNIEDRSLRVDVAEFTRQSLNPEGYIDWKASLESYFEYKDTPEDKQYKMAKVKLTKWAAT